MPRIERRATAHQPEGIAEWCRSTIGAATILVALCALAACGVQAYAPRTPQTPARSFATRHTTVRPHLIFHDEFDGTTLDRNIWYTCYNWADARAGCKTGPHELELYRPANVRVAGGKLLLTARHQNATWKGKTYGFTSGMIQSGGWPSNGSTPTFAFKYGYAEIRAQLPAGRIGMWPAFWLLPANNAWPPEVDIMEWQGVQPQLDNVTLWWSLPNGDRSIDYQTGTDLSTAYHTYGLDWQPSYMDFYFDRKRVMHVTGPHVPHQAMFVLINLAIGGWAPGQLKPPVAEFPTTYAIDYVRVWNRRPF